RFAAGCRGEGYVEANNACSTLFQLTHQKSVVTSRQGVGTDRLQRLVVNANDDDARISSAFAAQGKAKVERALLDVLEKQKASTLVAADSGIGEEPQTDGRHHHRNGGVGLVREPSGGAAEMRPYPRWSSLHALKQARADWARRHNPGSVPRCCLPDRRAMPLACPV